MCSGSGLTVFAYDIRRDRRVRKKPKIMVLLLDLVIKVGLLDSQTKSNGTHHGYVQFMACLCVDVVYMSPGENYIDYV